MERKKDTKKMTNEARKFLKTKDRIPKTAQNKLVFECKNGQKNSKKRPRIYVICDLEAEFAGRTALSDGRATRGGLHERVGLFP